MVGIECSLRPSKVLLNFVVALTWAALWAQQIEDTISKILS